MELKEFVRDVLEQITQGVRDAEGPVSEAGGIVSPATRFGPSSDTRDVHFATLEDGAAVFLVDFDVAVTVTESGTKGGDARLSIASVFSAGVSAKAADSTATVSRVRFKVPLALPVDEATSRKVKAANEKSRQPLPRPQGTQGSWMAG